jgi:hypothetical protein
MQNRGIAVARKLWDEMGRAVSPLPSGVTAVPEPIEGTAFLPGGLGLWMEEPERDSEFLTGGCMVVGQDFTQLRPTNKRGKGVPRSG